MTKSEFKRKKDGEGKYRATKALSNGSYVERNREEFSAYDANGTYLGWTNDQKAAEWMAENGYPNDTAFGNDTTELSLWEFWNDAVFGGEVTVAQARDGTQVIRVTHDLYMTAKPDEHGFEVEIIDDVEFYDTFGTEADPSILDLQLLTEGKLRLQ